MHNIASMSDILNRDGKRADIVFGELFSMGAFSGGIQAISASLRQQIFGIVNIANSLHTSLEASELYDEITKLNNQLKNCYSMLRTLMNLSEFTKFSEDNYTKHLIDVRTFTADIVTTCNLLIRSTGKQISCESPDTKLYIAADPERMMVALLNLLSNALLFTGEDAQIAVSVAQVGSDITIQVSDNGCGIPAENLSKVYTPFYSYRSNFTVSDNVGLGLTVVKAFTETCGANIIILTTQNEGTKVALKFPQAREDDLPLYLESKSSEYVSNRFSPIYLAMSDVCDLKFF